MKQNFFMLLAAVLLSGASAFAQSGNNGSLMGDVNGDGRVDIVDVTTVIDIYLNTVPDTGDSITYYWYAGHVTNNQFEQEQLGSVVAEQNSTSNTTGPSTLTMPTTTGDVLVYIYPTVWGTPNIVDDTGYGTGDGDYLNGSSDKCIVNQQINE